MAKVCPHDLSNTRVFCGEDFDGICGGNKSPTVLTVWKKSLVLNTNGFTVYDSNGDIVFRVDNYASNLIRINQLLLMDAVGIPLLTMRRKRMSIRNRWLGFCGDKASNSGDKAMFSIRIRRRWFTQTKAMADVFLASSNRCDFHIEGNRSSCTVFNNAGAIVAELKRKHATSDVMLGEDVLSMVVQPGYDQAFVMGMIITIDTLLIRKPIFLCRN